MGSGMVSVPGMGKAGARMWNGLAIPECQARSVTPDVVVVGIPFEGGAGGAGGASLGPNRIRELSSRMKTVDRIGKDCSWLRLRDLGDVETWRFDLPRTIEHIAKASRALFSEVTTPVITFGGDHSVTFPVVRGAAATRTLGLVWFDAHPDVLDGYQGSTISHGSPLRRIIEAGAVAAENVLLVGTRAYDPGEVEFIRDMGINEVRAAAFLEDPGQARRECGRFVREVAGRVGQFYVSIDIDVLDASCVPGTGTPVAGGIGTGELLGLVESLPEPVIAYDIVEFAPAHDIGAATDQAVLAMTTTILSRIAAARRH